MQLHVLDKLTGGGKEKNQRKSIQTRSDQSGSTSSEADVLYELMEIRGNEEDGAGTQVSNEDSTRGGGTRDRTAAETRGDSEIQGGTEASRGGEGGIGTRDGAQEAGGNGKGKGTARTGQIQERDWRER